jgi:YaiO family outer membrane protein
MRDCGKRGPRRHRRGMGRLALVRLCLCALGMAWWSGHATAAGPEDAAAGAVPKPPAAGAVRSLEVGAGIGRYSDGLGTSNGQSLRFSYSRAWRSSWSLDFGRQSRFGESSWDYGASYTRFLPRRTNLTVGLSSGTGQYLAPRYRFGATFGAPVLGLALSMGYLHEQSKAENRLDAISAGAARYQAHWIFALSGRCDFGQPGSTISTLGGAGVTWYRWKRIYLGASADFGDVSYMMVGPGRAVVNFHSSSFSLGFSRWFNSHAGMNLRLSYGKTSFYKVGGITASLFREW